MISSCKGLTTAIGTSGGNELIAPTESHGSRFMAHFHGERAIFAGCPPKLLTKAVVSSFSVLHGARSKTPATRCGFAAATCKPTAAPKDQPTTMTLPVVVLVICLSAKSITSVPSEVRARFDAQSSPSLLFGG